MLIDFSSQDLIAVSYLEGLGTKTKQTMAARIKLSKLDPESQENTKVLRNLFKKVKMEMETSTNTTFLLSNNDVLVVGTSINNENSKRTILSLINDLRSAFPQDSFLSSARSSELMTNWYDLSSDLRELVRECMNTKTSKWKLSEEKKSDDTVAFKNISAPSAVKDNARDKLTPQMLERLEEIMKKSNISEMHNTQTICHIDSENKPHMIFIEHFVPIGRLAKKVNPNLDIASSRWLFMHLTKVFDLRVLLEIARMKKSGSIGASFSINLNVSSIGSDEFKVLHSSLSEDERKTVMIEFQAIDILSDLELYHNTREYLQAKGYSVAVDGVSHELMEYTDRRKLKANFIKLIASGKLLALPRSSLSSIVRTIDSDNPRQYILTRCDDVQTAEFGRKLNIALFQGFYFDNFMRHEAAQRQPDQSDVGAPSNRVNISVRRMAR